MDYDSSSKFISSLAKFLQSLCNGYVEFDNGVHVIGHIYLSVDTGATIDYILNEKVCKTDENSVTFISNSFHAQPAEKPKPQGKRTPKDVDKTESKNEDGADSYGGSHTEPRSTNIGTLPTSGNAQNSHGAKRPYSPSQRQSSSKSGRSSPRHKKSRIESLDQNIQSQASNPASENSISSAPSPAADGVSLNTTTAQSSDAPQYSESYQQSFFNPDEENSMADEPEERDIKPSIDTDVTFIKEEFAPSSSCAQSDRDRSHGEDSSVYPYQSNQVFPGGFSGQGSFGASASGSLRSNFNASGDRSSHVFSAGQSSSQIEGGESSGDPSAIIDTILKHEAESPELQRTVEAPTKPSVAKSWSGNALYRRFPMSSYLPKLMLPKKYTCSKCNQSFSYPGNLSRHRKACEGNFDIKCMFCEKVFYRQDVLKMHMRSKHASNDVYWKQHGSSNNSNCAARSSNIFIDGEHFYSPVSVTSKTRLLSAFDLECKKCTFVSRDSLAMSVHKRSCNGKRHLTCSICSKVLSRYDSLAEHMRGIHGIGGKVQCRFCGKSFKYRPQMYQHQAVCVVRPPKFESELSFSNPASVRSDGMDSKISFPYDVTMSVDMDSIGHQLFESKS